MGEMVFKINGVDFLPYIADNKGIVWKRNDVDSADAGEMDDGTLRRDRVIMRRTLDVTIKPRTPLLTADISRILKAIYPQWVSVEFLDPLEGKVITRRFYSNNVPVTFAAEINGVAMWNGFTFPLIEQGVAGEGKT